MRPRRTRACSKDGEGSSRSGWSFRATGAARLRPEFPVSDDGEKCEVTTGVSRQEELRSGTSSEGVPCSAPRWDFTHWAACSFQGRNSRGSLAWIRDALGGRRYWRPLRGGADRFEGRGRRPRGFRRRIGDDGSLRPVRGERLEIPCRKEKPRPGRVPCMRPARRSSCLPAELYPPRGGWWVPRPNRGEWC